MTKQLEIIQEDDTKILPMSLITEGKGWLRMYEQGVVSKDNSQLIPAFYCLLTAFEFYLKAYICFKDMSFTHPDILKKLRHNFSKMSIEISRLAPLDIKSEVNNIIETYNLTKVDINNLKYPKEQRILIVGNEIKSGKHTMINLLEKMEAEVKGRYDEFLESVYPRETTVSALISIEYDGDDINDLNLKYLVSLCHTCRPKGVMVYKSTNYPWNQDDHQLQVCIECKAPYDARSMLP